MLTTEASAATKGLGGVHVGRAVVWCGLTLAVILAGACGARRSTPVELEEIRIRLPRPLTVANMSYSPQGDKIVCLVQGLPSWSVGECAAQVVGELAIVSLPERRFDFLPVAGDASAPAWRRSGKAVLFFRWDEWDKGAFLYEVDLAGSYHRLFSDEKSVASEEDDLPSSMAVTADDAYAAYSRFLPEERKRGTTELSLVDLASGKVRAVRTIPGYNPFPPAAHPTRAEMIAYLAVESESGGEAPGDYVPPAWVVVLADIHEGHQRVVDRVSSGWIHWLAWRPDGGDLAYWVEILRPDGGTERMEIRIWDPDTGEISVLPMSEEFTRSVTAIAWAPDGEHLACAYTDESGPLAQTELRFFRLQTE